MVIRILWILAALILVPFAIYEAFASGWLAAGVIVLFLLLPDIALVGAFDPDRQGMLRPRSVAFYNALHRPWAPLAIGALGIALTAAGGSALVFFAGLAWLAHIAADRALGYGLRDPDGSIRPVGGTRTRTLCQA